MYCIHVHLLDIDECQNQNGGCSDICANTDGSFTCSCEPARVLGDDERTCEDPMRK